MYSLNTGRLSKRINIWRYHSEKNPLGGEKTVLGKVATVWAEMKPTRGTEFLEYYKDANALQYKVTIRYRPGLTEKDVLEHNGRQFEINSIININEENVALEIYCTERKDKVIL